MKAVGVFVWVIAIMGLLACGTQAAETLYELLPGTTFQAGCVEPCKCPIRLPEEMTGTFLLVPAEPEPWFTNYQVNKISWTVLDANGNVVHKITGQGTYKLGGDFALTHQLVLDINIDGRGPQHLDSGLIPGGFEFSHILISVTRGTPCFNIWMNINAAPSVLPVFEDVPSGHWAYDFIMPIYDAGIIAECSVNPPLFCPDDIITRGQTAVFMEASLGVTGPPPCTGTVFNDVNAATVGPAFCGFIEDFYARGITGGCGGGNYCPNNPVTRQQMAVFLEAALGRIPGQLPASCSGTFNNVNASTVGEYVCRIIEDFAAQGITGGCGGGNFCPSSPVTRAQMAVFLVAAPPPLNP